MKINEIVPPRIFKIGSTITRHCADIYLQSDEMVTFLTDSGKEYDVMKKKWGFFATPSINNRLKFFCFKTALIEDSNRKLFICLVEEGKEEEFFSFLSEDSARVKCWLSDLIF